ncbi:hypothetical protein EDD86DRAFT_173902, partial [Gorgonomyces haynaldii]
KRDYTKDYQDRPARRQLEERAAAPNENLGSYNIWFSKWAGDGNSARMDIGLSKATHRCVLERDAGKTRANKYGLFCLHFCHGKCIKGPDCTHLHRIPLDTDEGEVMKDCFGRDKFRNYRKDMGGVGSFEKRTSTLFVGNVDINDRMEEILEKHFGEWGEIENMTVIKHKGAAYIRYKNLLNAEFAREAMLSQSLESNETLNVRWAAEDPDLEEKATLKRKAEEKIMEQVASKLPIIGEKGTILDYQNHYKQPKLE